MSHIRVDDDMHRRVMSAVSKALDEQNAKEDKKLLSYEDVKERSSDYYKEHGPKAEVTPVRRKAKVSGIRIISIAACCVLVAGGAFALAKNFFGSSATKTASFETAANAVAGERDYGRNDTAVEGIKNETAAAANEDESKEEETTNKEIDAALGGENNAKTFAPQTKTANSNIRSYLPFKVKTVGTSKYAEKNISSFVFTGEKGEKAILFYAPEGTDLIKNYYPKFKGDAALLQTEGGQVFYAVDTSVGAKEQVGSTGPYDAVMWTKDGTVYMLSFNTKTDVAVFISLMEKIG